MAGDFRTSEQPSLVSMHTLFLREHNRIAKSLKQLNPGWGDERLYQESRRILIAEWQHVIYNEWIPVLIGNIIQRVRFLKICYKSMFFHGTRKPLYPTLWTNTTHTRLQQNLQRQY